MAYPTPFRSTLCTHEADTHPCTPAWKKLQYMHTRLLPQQALLRFAEHLTLFSCITYALQHFQEHGFVKGQDSSLQ